MTSRKKQKTLPKNINDIVYGTKEYENQFYSDYIKYTQKITDIDCKSYMMVYLKSINKYFEYYTTIQAKKFNPYGIYIKMQTDGILLPDTEKKLISEFIDELDSSYKDKIEKKENLSKQRTIQESKKIKEILSSIEYYIDLQLDTIRNNKKANPDTTDILNRYKIHPTHFPILVSQISETINKSVNDLRLAKNKKDEQLIEGYSFLTPKQLTAYINFLNKLQDNIISSSPKKERKKRKVKPKLPEQLVSKLQVVDSCEKLNLKSYSKKEIIGANIIFVYNIKTRSIIKYISSQGFSIKGSTLLNIDSSNKKTVRNPEKLFSSINPTNCQFMERLWDSVKCKQTITNSRINKNCILISCLNSSDGN